MANTAAASNAFQGQPIKLVDNGDGTYSLSTSLTGSLAPLPPSLSTLGLDDEFQSTNMNTGGQGAWTSATPSRSRCLLIDNSSGQTMTVKWAVSSSAVGVTVQAAADSVSVPTGQSVVDGTSDMPHLNVPCGEWLIEWQCAVAPTSGHIRVIVIEQP